MSLASKHASQLSISKYAAAISGFLKRTVQEAAMQKVQSPQKKCKSTRSHDMLLTNQCLHRRKEKDGEQRRTRVHSKSIMCAL